MTQPVQLHLLLVNELITFTSFSVRTGYCLCNCFYIFCQQNKFILGHLSLKIILNCRIFCKNNNFLKGQRDHFLVKTCNLFNSAFLFNICVKANKTIYIKIYCKKKSTSMYIVFLSVAISVENSQNDTEVAILFTELKYNFRIISILGTRRSDNSRLCNNSRCICVVEHYTATLVASFLRL